MITNKLNLNIPDILTPCVLRIEDLSIYNELMPYVCPTVQVKIPGFDECAVFTQDGDEATTVHKNFVLNLSACNLGLQSQNCTSEFETIPDGVYTITYSLSPNDKLYVEYDHLRVTNIKLRLKKELCELDLAACEPSVEVFDKLKQLNLINDYLDAAKAKVEFCNDSENGVILYAYADKLLSEYSCKLY
jgi:hypothetical protein